MVAPNQVVPARGAIGVEFVDRQAGPVAGVVCQRVLQVAAADRRALGPDDGRAAEQAGVDVLLSILSHRLLERANQDPALRDQQSLPSLPGLLRSPPSGGSGGGSSSSLLRLQRFAVLLGRDRGLDRVVVLDLEDDRRGSTGR